MKKFSLLPLAEMVEDTESLSEEYKKNNFIFRIHPFVYAIAFIIMVAEMFIKPAVGIFSFGAIFLIASLDSSGTVKVNRKIVENNFWNRFPLFIVGLSIMFLVTAAIFADTEKKGAETAFHATKESNAILKAYAVTLAALLIGRILWLIAATIASSVRKNRCTCQILAEYIVPEEQGRKHIFKYEYEGTSYWFVYKSSLHNDIQDIGIYIDPDAPELFYWYVMMEQNAKSLKRFLASLFLFLVITAIIWVPLVWIYVITPLLVDKY